MKNEEIYKYKSILFVPSTPGGDLLKELRKWKDELNGKNGQIIKIVVKGGVKIERILTNKYPFKTEKGDEKSCPLYKGGYGNLKVPCSTNNTGYRWSCKTYKEKNNLTKVYEGDISSFPEQKNEQCLI